MVYTEEQVKEVKRQILAQTKHLSEVQKKAIEEQINKMSAQELEEFVRQQMTSPQEQEVSNKNSDSQKGIF